MHEKFLKKMIFCFASLLIIGCGSQSEQTQGEVRIGVVAPLTGEGASYGASMKRGFDLAFKGHEGVRIIYEDSKLSARDGVSAINKLIGVDRVELVYGAAASGVTTAILPIADEHETVLISSISTADTLTNASSYFFRNVPRNAVQGQTAAEYLAGRNGISSVAIFNENDEYGVNLASSFKENSINNGMSIVFESSYLSTDTDFRSQLTRIKESGAQAVFVPGNYEETGIILRQASELGVDALFIGGDGSYSPSLIDFAGEAAEGFLCTIQGVDRSSVQYQNFVAKFTEEYGQAPDVYDAYAYEAGLIVKRTITEGGDDIRGFLSTSTFDTFSGPLRFEGSDMIRPYGVSIVEDGAFQYQ